MTYELKLTGKHGVGLGLIAMIDDQDVPMVLAHSWCAQKITSTSGKVSFYAVAKVRNKNVLLHRFLLGARAGVVVDHRDRNTLNCRRYNLRECTQAENVRNRDLNKNSTTGVKGVWFSKRDRKYKACIRVQGKTRHLGTFMTADDAASAYREAAIRLHGEFASFG